MSPELNTQYQLGLSAGRQYGIIIHTITTVRSQQIQLIIQFTNMLPGAGSGYPVPGREGEWNLKI